LESALNLQFFLEKRKSLTWGPVLCFWTVIPYVHIPIILTDRLCGLVVRILRYRSGGPVSIPGTTRKEKRVVGLERGPLSLVSTTEELLDRKVAAPSRKPREYGRRDTSR
jgi:hypothetical protein